MLCLCFAGEDGPQPKDNLIPRGFFRVRESARSDAEAEGGDAVATEDQTAPNQTRGAQDATVLLVEDNQMVRALTRDLLESYGFRVLTAESGSEALQVAAQNRGAISLLLTDVVMPGMHGDVLAVEFARLEPGIPVLFMSGFTDDSILPRAVLDGVAPFLPKPFTPAALLQKVKEALKSPAE